MAAKGDGEGDGAAGPGGGRRLTWIKIGAAVLLMQALTIGLVAALTWVIVQHHKVRRDAPPRRAPRPPTRCWWTPPDRALVGPLTRRRPRPPRRPSSSVARSPREATPPRAPWPSRRRRACGASSTSGTSAWSGCGRCSR